MGRDFSLYVADHWNTLDLLGLGLVTGGLVVRCADGQNPWGRALYALSAPLVFSRLLFFAQMLRFHGPMIQVSCMYLTGLLRHIRIMPQRYLHVRCVVMGPQRRRSRLLWQSLSRYAEVVACDVGVRSTR